MNVNLRKNSILFTFICIPHPNTIHMKTLFIILNIFLFTFQISAQPLQRVAPEQVGMNSRHLTYADQAIEKAINNKDIPGAVLAVVRHGKLAYLKAYGCKQTFPTREPMDTHTVFDMASVSKSISTAICALILTERGQLRLTDPVNLYLPAFSEEIRITDLLTHTSGLPAYAPVNKLAEQYGSPNPERLIEYIADCKPVFKPGSDFQYSCLNYIALQHIIETISGQSLRDFAKANIFDPLGMSHTDYCPTGEILERCAPTEKQKDGSVLKGVVHDPLARIMNGGISGNAGIFSDANDLAILSAMLLNGGEYNGHRILSPLGVKAMRSIPRQVSALGRSLGWDIFSPYASNHGDLFGPNTYGHTGYTGTSIILDPDSDTSVILLTNSVHPDDKGKAIRLRSLIANAVAASIYPTERTYTDHYYKRFLQFEEEPAIGPEDIVMLGNSLTEAGKDWGARLKKKNVRNRGIIGDEAMGVYDRLHQILPGHPAKLFLLIGINDVSHDLSADSVVTLITRLIDRIQQESPQTKIYLQSLLPINESVCKYKTMIGKTDVVPAINQQLKALTASRQITFIDLFPLFTEKGTNVLQKELTNDGLHLTEEGYKIWSKKLRKYL